MNDYYRSRLNAWCFCCARYCRRNGHCMGSNVTGGLKCFVEPKITTGGVDALTGDIAAPDPDQAEELRRKAAAFLPHRDQQSPPVSGGAV